MKPVHELSITEAGVALRNGSLTSAELTETLLHRIAAIDPHLSLFFLVTEDRARADARRADAELRAGRDRGPLHGIPYGLKDILDTEGIPTTCNSRLFVDRRPAEDSTVEARLRAGGAVLLGKLSTSEFACGGPGDDLPFPVSKNPWNREYYTGGSSSGSAGAVASGMMRLAIGTDTGGSARVPAAYCGVVGLKPTYGLVSKRGLFPLSPSLDHCAPLARSVEDMALVMNAIAGFDPRDPASVERPYVDHRRKIGEGIEGLRIGYARQTMVEAKVFPESIANLDKAGETLRRLGAVVEEVKLPDFELFRACSRVIVSGEAFALHEETLRTRPLDYGRQTYQRLIAGAALSASDLIQAFRLRRELIEAINIDILCRYDAIVMATALGQAPRLDSFVAGTPPSMAGSPTIIGNLTGNPAISVPFGLSIAGLPLGLQIIGRPFDEPTILQIAAALEESQDGADVDFEFDFPPITRTHATTSPTDSIH